MNPRPTTEVTLTQEEYDEIRIAVDNAALHLRRAAYHQASMWDALRKIELALDADIDSPNVSDLACEFQTPACWDEGPDHEQARKMVMEYLPEKVHVLFGTEEEPCQKK